MYVSVKHGREGVEYESMEVFLIMSVIPFFIISEGYCSVWVPLNTNPIFAFHRCSTPLFETTPFSTPERLWAGCLGAGKYYR